MSRVATTSDHVFFALTVRKRPTDVCQRLHTLQRPHLQSLSKAFSTSTHDKYDDLATLPSNQPRWKATPIGMVTRGTPNRPVEPENEFVVNEDPEALNRVLIKVLGKYGNLMLSDEAKWLVVTHKSFDHGRKRIVDLQASLHMIAASATTPEPSAPDQWGREPFKHPVLEGLAGLTVKRKSEAFNKQRMAKLASYYGLDTVLRWKPKQPDKWKESGVEIILTQALYAIVGAISLEKGGEFANRIARERILAPLGFKA
ncbi:MAG: hypothetical protein Q9211_006069 [Gyalolechia sp. 1 TL-2023]